MTRFALTALLLSASTQAAWSLDYVTLNRDDRAVQLKGKILTEAADGGLLMEDREGILWAIQPDELVRRGDDSIEFQPMQGDELKERLLEQLPEGFRTHSTAHYLIGYNTSPAYAQWCGALYERLYWAFHNYWDRRGFTLKDPAMPLVAIIFDRQATYEQYARAELGEATRNIVGYFSLQTNRVTMYDLTGTRGLQGAPRRGSSTAQINALLMQPGAERMVATIIHEATHHLAYNCGMHTRYADIPLWVSEGLAVYFETPDLTSSRGWRNIGEVNRSRLEQFRRDLRARPADSLETLLRDDRRFREPATALSAYAEAWALNYFLIHKHLKEYQAFLQVLAQKQPLIFDSPDERLAAFTAAFDGDLQQLDVEFVRYMRTVR